MHNNREGKQVSLEHTISSRYCYNFLHKAFPDPLGERGICRKGVVDFGSCGSVIGR